MNEHPEIAPGAMTALGDFLRAVKAEKLEALATQMEARINAATERALEAQAKLAAERVKFDEYKTRETAALVVERRELESEKRRVAALEQAAQMRAEYLGHGFAKERQRKERHQ